MANRDNIIDEVEKLKENEKKLEEGSNNKDYELHLKNVNANWLIFDNVDRVSEIIGIPTAVLQDHSAWKLKKLDDFETMKEYDEWYDKKGYNKAPIYEYFKYMPLEEKEEIISTLKKHARDRNYKLKDTMGVLKKVDKNIPLNNPYEAAEIENKRIEDFDKSVEEEDKLLEKLEIDPFKGDFSEDNKKDDNEVVVNDNRIEVEGGAALSNKIILPKPKPDQKKTGLAKFTQNVGNALSNVATFLPEKMEEVWADKDRKRMFLRGLEIINSSSGITPLSQAKSPLGKISEGLLRAEGKFTAEDIAWYKAKNPERKFETQRNLSLGKIYEKYDENYYKGQSDMSVDTRYNEVYKLAQGGKEPPVGILESTFSGLEKILDEVGLLDEANALINRNQDTTEFSDKDLIKFKEIVTAATFQQIVGKAKLLYPVSNKDLELLKKTVGDISTSPQAFRALVASQKALSEIGKLAHSKSFDIAFEGEGQANFRELSRDAAAKELAETMKAKVNPETYMKLFGVKEPTSPFQIINAFYYQELEPVYKKMEGEGGYFEIFKEKELLDTEETLDLIKKRQLEEKENKTN